MVSADTPPPSLLDQIKRSRVVPFVGAGISLTSGLPNWEQLLRAVFEYGKHHALLPSSTAELNQAIASRQLELAADVLVSELGDEFPKALRTVLRPAGIKPNSVHRLLGSVRWPAIITTNYDDLLPATLPAEFKRLTWRDDAQLGTALRRADPHLLFAHGCLDRPESIVLTAGQYRECLRHAPYRTYLKIICAQYTLLFLGFSFSDRDVQWLLEDLRHEFGQSDMPHFALLNADEAGALRSRSLRDNFNINVLPYQVENGQHTAVEKFMRSVVDHCPPGQIVDKAAGLQDLSSLTSMRTTLTAQSYLEQFSETCHGLARLGYTRTSWVALRSAVESAKTELSLSERVRATLDLVALMRSDGQYWSASKMLEELSELPLQDELSDTLLCEFYQRWFHTALENYYSDIPERAIKIARAVNCQPDVLRGMEAQLKLFKFLHGDPSMLLLTGREGVDD